MTGLISANQTVSQYQQTLCPAFREVLTLPPEIIGRLAAFGEVGMEYALDNPITAAVQTVWNALDKAVQKVTGGFVGINVASVQTLQNKDKLVILATASYVALQVLAERVRENPIEVIGEAPVALLNGAIATGHIAKTVAYHGGRFALQATGAILYSPISLVKFAVKAPFRLFNLALATPKALLGAARFSVVTGVAVAKYAATSKIVLSSLAYVGLRKTYDYGCAEYEASLAEETPSLDFFTRVNESYTNKRAKFSVIREADKRAEEEQQKKQEALEKELEKYRETKREHEVLEEVRAKKLKLKSNRRELAMLLFTDKEAVTNPVASIILQHTSKEQIASILNLPPVKQSKAILAYHERLNIICDFFAGDTPSHGSTCLIPEIDINDEEYIKMRALADQLVEEVGIEPLPKLDESAYTSSAYVCEPKKPFELD